MHVVVCCSVAVVCLPAWSGLVGPKDCRPAIYSWRGCRYGCGSSTAAWGGDSGPACGFQTLLSAVLAIWDHYGLSLLLRKCRLFRRYTCSSVVGSHLIGQIGQDFN